MIDAAVPFPLSSRARMETILASAFWLKTASIISFAWLPPVITSSMTLYCSSVSAPVSISAIAPAASFTSISSRMAIGLLSSASESRSSPPAALKVMSGCTSLTTAL